MLFASASCQRLGITAGSPIRTDYASGVQKMTACGCINLNGIVAMHGTCGGLSKRHLDSDVTNPPLPLGTETEYGTIEMIGCLNGERYYWMVDQDGMVSMMPDFIIERDGNTK